MFYKKGLALLTSIHRQKSMETTATLHHISRERLSSILLSPHADKVAIVDVRDDDYVGGHIHSAINVPSSSLDTRIPEVIQNLGDKEIVVFHCALSQQRGPGAALIYLKERNARSTELHSAKGLGSGAQESSANGKDQTKIRKEDKELELVDQGKDIEVSTAQDSGARTKNAKHQEVFVLDGGFVKWQEKYACSLGTRSLNATRGVQYYQDRADYIL